jgi:hypothetical protein
MQLARIVTFLPILIFLACGDTAEPAPSTPAEKRPAAPAGPDNETPGVDKGLPAAEAGFVDVPAAPSGGSPAAGRLFYAFRAADAEPDMKPLIVALDGGPGWATTGGLFLEGTGPYSVDLRGARGAPLLKSARSLTEIANVLYVDGRSTGFSYDFGTAPKGCYRRPTDDAADFLRVVFTFLGEHPRLSKAKLVYVGQSYGGMRVTEMVNLLLDYTSDRAKAYDLGPLVERWAARAIGPKPVDGPFSTAALGERLGGAVLVQPFIFGSAQLQAQTALIAADPDLNTVGPDADSYDVRRPRTASDEVLARFAAALANHETTTTLFGLDLDGIPGLKPADRVGARRSPSFDGPSLPEINEAFVGRLGALEDGDAYFHLSAGICGEREDNELIEFPQTAESFARVAAHIPLFITNARYDTVIHSPAILKILAHAKRRPVADNAPRPNVARPGWFTFDVPLEDGTVRRTEVRFPRYEAGHAVAESDGAGLVEDIAAWFHDHQL